MAFFLELLLLLFHACKAYKPGINHVLNGSLFLWLVTRPLTFPSLLISYNKLKHDIDFLTWPLLGRFEMWTILRPAFPWSVRSPSFEVLGKDKYSDKKVSWNTEGFHYKISRKFVQRQANDYSPVYIDKLYCIKLSVWKGSIPEGYRSKFKSYEQNDRESRNFKVLENIRKWCVRIP